MVSVIDNKSLNILKEIVNILKDTADKMHNFGNSLAKAIGQIEKLDSFQNMKKKT